MTDLDSPRKNNDCYFYYYSSCAKGDSCTFRHEPSALGCETMCSFWKEGKCLNVHCNFRHMELRKNRKAIPCYWESQPGGCLKPHCPFKHQSSDGTDLTEASDKKIVLNAELQKPNISLELGQASEKNCKNTPVESLVVNFEEESDNESSTFSPLKNSNRVVKVKTLEEIKLEKIQAESAAYYSYPGVEQSLLETNADDLRQRILTKMRKRVPVVPIDTNDSNQTSQINVKRKRSLDSELDLAVSSLDEHIIKQKKLKLVPKKSDTDVGTFKVKTLEEIRAERRQKPGDNVPDSQTSDSKMDVDENVVSSTIRDEYLESKSQKVSPRRKIKLKRVCDFKEDIESSGDESSKVPTPSNSSLGEEDVEKRTNEETMEQTNEEQMEQTIKEAIEQSKEMTHKEIKELKRDEIKKNIVERLDSNRAMDEVLLLEDDDDLEGVVSLKGEDELLKDIDDLLED